MSRVDWIALAEAAYRLESSDGEWTRELCPRIAREFELGRGSVGGLVARDKHGHFVVEPYSHRAPPLAMEVARLSWRLQPRTTERFFASRGVVRSSALSPGAGGLIARLSSRVGVGIADARGLMAGDDQGRYLSVMAISPRLCEPLPARLRAAWRNAADHIGAAMRLRANLQSLSLDDPAAEAIFDRNGKTIHIRHELASNGHRRALHDAIEQRFSAADVGEEALDLWPALCSGRWSLVDRFDTDGRRFVVAYRNDVQAGDPRALSGREQQVARRVALGARNGDVAQELGLSESTVRSHVSSLLRKLRLESPAELVLRWSARTQGLAFSIEDSQLLVARTDVPPRSGLEPLTTAERAVLEALLMGHSNCKIARQRGVSLRTVETQITSIYAKLGVRSKRELAALVFSPEE